MRVLKFLAVAGLATILSATASAQVLLGTGGGATISDSLGGTWNAVLPSPPNSSAAAVGVAVTGVDSVTIDGLSHTWIGDLQATLVDPNGVKHNLFVRPGYLNTGAFGDQGDFLGGSYTFVTSGAPNNMPTTSGNTNPPAGTYNQNFGTGASVWTSNPLTVLNTPLSSVSGPLGNWSLHIYDWGGGDVGSYTGWSFSGNSAGPNSGAAGCDCFGANPNCFTGPSAVGSGCPNTAGSGAVLTGAGQAEVGVNDTFSLSVAGGPPGKPGLVLSGTGTIAPVYTIADSAGGLCTSGATIRGDVFVLDAAGAASMPTFKLSLGAGKYGAAAGVGFETYQFWYRDPGGAATCTGDTASSDFNFSNGWDVTWL